MPQDLKELEKSHIYVPTVSTDESALLFNNQPQPKDALSGGFRFARCGLTLGCPNADVDAFVPGDKAGSWTLHLTFFEDVATGSPGTAPIVTGPIIDILNYADVASGKVEREAITVCVMVSEDVAKQISTRAPYGNLPKKFTAQYGP